MVLIPLWRFLDVPKLTAGRRRLALQRMRATAASDKRWAELLPCIDEAIAAQERMIALRAARPQSLETSRMHAVNAVALDRQLDRAIAAVHGVLSNVVRGLDPDDPDAAMANHVLQRLFPGGVAPITQLPYVDQYAAVDQLLTRLRTDPELMEAVEALSLSKLVDRIDTLNRAYGQHVTRANPISAEDLRDADREAWIAVCTVVASVMGLAPTHTEADDRVRGTLLQPFVEQQSELRKLRARRSTAGASDELDPEGAVENADEDEGEAREAS